MTEADAVCFTSDDKDNYEVKYNTAGYLETVAKSTAINNVNASTSSAQAQGKFIENGRLVIKKNGKHYNAAGQRMK